MKRRRMRYGEESGGTSGFRVLISSEMSRLAIFYPQLLQPTCVLLYLPRSKR